MFKVEVSDLSKTEHKLLYNIESLLIEQNSLLKEQNALFKQAFLNKDVQPKERKKQSANSGDKSNTTKSKK